MRDRENVAVFVDTETSGLGRDASIIQIAGIAVDLTDWTELETFERKLRFDEASADEAALRINHYDRAVWEREAVPPGPAITRDFCEFLNRYSCLEMTSARTTRKYKVARLAGHNVRAFDIPKIEAVFKAHGKFFPAGLPFTLDTLSATPWFFIGAVRPMPKSFRLTDLAEWLGVKVEGAHEALTDVRLSIAVAKHLLSNIVVPPLDVH